MHSCEGRTFQAHHVNSLTVTVYDCVTDLLKYSILYCQIKKEMQKMCFTILSGSAEAPLMDFNPNMCTYHIWL